MRHIRVNISFTLDAIDGALRSAGFDLDARLFPAGGPVLDVDGVVDE